MPMGMHYINNYHWLISEAPHLAFQLSNTFLKKHKNIEWGNNKPTLFIPGFGASNTSTYIIRKILNNKNHNIIKWELNKNTGFNENIIENTLIQVKEIAHYYQQPINLIGQSVGGCFARSIANTIPEYVNNVITLASPINDIKMVNPHSLKQYDTTAGLINAAIIHHSEHIDTFFPNPPLPVTSIFSKMDNIVHWSQSIIKENKLSENIEVDTTHFGMMANLEIIEILSNRLNQYKTSWKKWI